MKNNSIFISLFYGTFLMAACSGNGGAGGEQGSTATGHDHEHAGAAHDHSGGEQDHTHPHEGEHEKESGIVFTLDATYDRVRDGARLILAYDADTNSFKGTVENTTQETLSEVRIEVHLSNGAELGPTELTHLAPGETQPVELEATGSFNSWSAHTEVGSGEHGHVHEQGEHDHEHPHEHE